MKKDEKIKFLTAIFNKILEKYNLNIKYNLGKIRIDLDGLKEIELIHIDVQGIQLIYYLKIIKKVTKTDINLLSLNKHNIPYQILLISEYINPENCKRLHERNIQFVDLAGNLYINHFPLYLFIVGNKLKVPWIINNYSRLFKATGIKMVFALLIDKDLVNTSYRNISKRAQISLGEISFIMNELKKEKFLLEKGKNNRILLNKKVLFERWTISYNENLKPKLFVGSFKQLGKKSELKLNNGLYSGEYAAEILTNYITPEHLTIYVDENYLDNFIIKNKLAKDRRGKIKIYKKFWSYNFKNINPKIVHPFLVYADLISNDNPRAHEVAKIIYEKYINKYL